MLYDRVARRLGGRAISVEALSGGVSAPTRLLTYDRSGGTERAVVRSVSRLASREGALEALARSHALLSVLAADGLPVPTPLYLDPDGSSVGEPVLVLAYLDGAADLPALSVALPAMAELLARVHRFPTEHLGAVPLAVEDDPTGEVRSLLEAIPGTDPDSLDLRTMSPSRAPVLLHGDFWPGNLLWRDGAISGLIDWEDAALGDPERDLATARTELTVALGPDAAIAFRRHYDAVADRPVDERLVDLWTVCSAAGLLLHVSDWGLPPDREERMRTVAEEVLGEVLSRLARA